MKYNLKSKCDLSKIKKVVPWVLLIGIAFFMYLGEKIEQHKAADLQVISQEKKEDADIQANDGESDPVLEEERQGIETVIFIDVGGAVVSPCVVQLPQGSRVFEAIDSAGGLKANADTKNLNLAQVLNDGEKIYVLTKEEAVSSADSANSVSKTSGEGVTNTKTNVGVTSTKTDMVNLNQANSQALQTLKGVGPSTAERILEYRKQYGAFKSIEELKNVKGIGEKTFEKLKNYIYVE